MEELQKKLEEISKKLMPRLMIIAKVEVSNFIQNNFDNEGFEDKQVNKWVARKREKPQKILTQSEALADSLKTKAAGNDIIVASHLKYAKIHNEGGRAGRNGSANIPKRQFIGESEALEKIIETEIESLIKRELP